MRQLVTRLCAEMWFVPSPGGEVGGRARGERGHGRRQPDRSTGGASLQTLQRP